MESKHFQKVMAQEHEAKEKRALGNGVKKLIGAKTFTNAFFFDQGFGNASLWREGWIYLLRRYFLLL